MQIVIITTKIQETHEGITIVKQLLREDMKIVPEIIVIATIITIITQEMTCLHEVMKTEIITTLQEVMKVILQEDTIIQAAEIQEAPEVEEAIEALTEDNIKRYLRRY